MKGKALIHVSTEWKQKPDSKWLFWLIKKLEAEHIEVRVSEQKSVTGQETLQLQKQFDIADERVFLVPQKPGNLTLNRFFEKVSTHKLPNAMLVAQSNKLSKVKPSSQKLLGGAKQVTVPESFLDRLIATREAYVVLIWLQGDELLEYKQKIQLDKPKLT